MILAIRATIFFLVFNFVQNRIYLYNTEDAVAVEYYDCVFAQSLYYCRRPDPPIELVRDNDTVSCQENGGIIHRFSELRLDNINISTILHEWKSSIERVEQYSRFRQDSSETDGYLCQCVNTASFGKTCEYRLPEGTTFSETLDWQVKMKVNERWNMQSHGDIVCYETLSCDSGLLCLDWREICDGIQQCMYGYDEENCDLLEMNICDDDDEYRCMNGMCIPQEYFLDGDFDCLDWSDEMQYQESWRCAIKPASTQCDDHMCPSTQRSCGDGECILHRLVFQESEKQRMCNSGRDRYFMCETVSSIMMWTMSNGRCYPGRQNEERRMWNHTAEEECEYLLRCALSAGGHIGCPCEYDSSCAEILDQNCSLSLIPYPQRPLVTPYMVFLYNRSRTWHDKLPSLVLIDGAVKCRGTFVYTNRTIPFSTGMTVPQIIEDLFCRQGNDTSHRCHNANESSDLCHEWNPCMSITRVNDGIFNCRNQQDESNRTKNEIEESCSRVKQHRFHCSAEQSTCLSIMALGNKEDDCYNQFDELWLGENQKLSKMQCDNQWKADCSLLRQYIEQSWITPNKSEMLSRQRIPFRWYCDTFWDLDSAEDENLSECRRWWICAPDQWRCKTGQCIDPTWKSDVEWDCADASDAERQFKLIFECIQTEEKSIDISNNTSHIIMPICNIITSFPCLSSHPSDQRLVNVNIDQLGDGKIDCAGAIDERNTFQHCSEPAMLGLNFKCPSSNTCIPYYLHCTNGSRCPNRTDDEHWCSRQQKPPDCEDQRDFICFNSDCAKNGRCDTTVSCRDGEDEYMCDDQYVVQQKKVIYRRKKESIAKSSKPSLQLNSFPVGANTTESIYHVISTVQSTVNARNKKSVESFVPAFQCNRGIGIFSSNDTMVCFCPSQYYGDKCQYHADRVLVLIHLNLSQSMYTTQSDQKIVLKLLVLFLFDNQTWMTYQFHVRPTLEISTFKKKMVHFLYSHTNSSRQQRKIRFINRSDIIDSQPYSIRIEAYENYDLKRPSLIAVWEYDVDFDFLPVYRFAKVLNLTKSTNTPNPCSSNPCHQNQQCQQLMNNSTRHICLCQTNFTGTHCSQEHDQCRKGYCVAESLCKPNYRGLIRGGSSPYCICPSNRYGDRCDLQHDRCQSNPCLNGASCFPSSLPDQVTCLCTKEYYGLKCEGKKVHIHLSLDTNLHYAGAVIQFFDINAVSLNLILVHQEVHEYLPPFIEYSRDTKTVPAIILSKLYSSHENVRPDFYILSVHINIASIDGRTELSETNRCPHVYTLSNDSSPIRYHHICHNNSNLLCFRDDVYLCICADNHTRVECFLNDHQLDRCPYCLNGGRCLPGDHTRSSDFLCLCPPCLSGKQCQFNSESFTFTLDQLLYTDLVSNHQQTTVSILMLFSLLGFLLGIPNNLFSFVTFCRMPCLRNGIGHYLLLQSIISQINLGLFMARLIHIIINIVYTDSNSNLDNVLCKLLNYLLLSSGRMVFWFSSLIAVERVYTTLVLNGRWLKQPHIARRLIAFSITGILLTSVHEVVFYRSLPMANTDDRSICMFEFPTTHRSLWMAYHKFTSALHSLLPFLINLGATIIISVVVVKKKMNTLRAKRHDQTNQSAVTNISRLCFIFNVLSENKELVIGPGITLIPQVFFLPLFIFSFILDCQNIENSRLRYLLIAFYWTSFIPQLISFFLYISPSSFYSSEWRKTKIGRSMNTIFHWHQSATNTALTGLSGAQDMSNTKY